MRFRQLKCHIVLLLGTSFLKKKTIVIRLLKQPSLAKTEILYNGM